MEAKNDNQSLGDRMKNYEKVTQLTLDNTKPYMIRLDGRSFSKFTASLQQPYDLRFVIAMTLTAEDLMNEFHATTAYVQSDEISLTFFPEPHKETGVYPVLPFNGKIQKLVSVSAGYASVRFNYHLITLFIDPAYHSEMRILETESVLDPRAIGKIKSSYAHFDSRCFQLPSDEEVFNCILWRSQDAYKNVVSKIAQFLYGPKACHKKNTREKEIMIKEKDPTYFDKLHPYISHGVFIKRELYATVGKDGKECMRTKTKYVPADRLHPSQIDLWCRFLKVKNHDIVHPALYNEELH